MAKIYFRGTTYGGYVAGERTPSSARTVDITSVSSTISDGDIIIHRSDDLVVINFVAVTLASALAAGSDVALFDLDDLATQETTYVPEAAATGIVAAGSAAAQINIATSGVVSLNNISGGSIATTAAINGQITFIIE